jgi:hypothetical protein
LATLIDGHIRILQFVMILSAGPYEIRITCGALASGLLVWMVDEAAEATAGGEQLTLNAMAWRQRSSTKYP